MKTPYLCSHCIEHEIRVNFSTRTKKEHIKHLNCLQGYKPIIVCAPCPGMFCVHKLLGMHGTGLAIVGQLPQNCTQIVRLLKPLPVNNCQNFNCHK